MPKIPFLNKLIHRKAFTASVLGAVILLTLLPIAIKYYLIGFIEANNFDQVTINDVDLNLFSGTAAIKDVKVLLDQQHKLELGELRFDFRWLGLLEGGIIIESAYLRDAKLAVLQNSDGRWEVIAPFSTQETVESEDVGEEFLMPRLAIEKFNFQNVSIQVNTQSGSGSFVINEFDLQKLSTWHDRPALLKMDASWNGNPILINLKAELNKQVPVFSGEIVGTTLPLGSFKSALPEPLHDLSASASLKLQVSGQRLMDQSIELNLAGAVDVTDLILGYQQLQLDLGAFQWQGETKLQITDTTTGYQLSGNTQLSNFSVMDTRNELTIIRFSDLLLKELKLDQHLNAGFEQLQLNQLALINPKNEEHYLLRQNAIVVENFDLQQNELSSTKNITLSGGNYRLTLDKSSQILGLEDFEATLKSLQQPVDEQTPVNLQESTSDAPLKFAISQFSLSGNNLLSLHDQSFKNTFKADIDIHDLSLSSIVLNEPDAVSPFSLKASFGEFSDIDFNGQLKIFSEHPELTMKGALKRISLPQISPYLERYMGYQFITGQYDHDISLQLAKQHLTMKNNLQIRKLELQAADEKSAQSTDEKMDIPLPMALNMLSDSDGNIKLDVPIEGNTNDPDIGLNSVISSALSKALKQGSMSYLQYALQPYGAALIAADYLIDQASSISFDPVLFQTGSTAVATESTPYVEKISKVLVSKNGLEINLCGSAGSEDQQFLALQTTPETNLEEQLNELAKARATILKRLFIEQGIESQRLYLCKASYDEKGISGVLLSM
ncbi:MAG: DUF748 domain-containing protein [Oceanicoccus sp.]